MGAEWRTPQPSPLSYARKSSLLLAPHTKRAWVSQRYSLVRTLDVKMRDTWPLALGDRQG